MEKSASQWRWAGFAAAMVGAVAASYGLGRYHTRARSDVEPARRPLYYVDPMHPAFRSDMPGLAPDCGMQLVPVFAGSRNDPSPPSAPSPAGTVAIDGTTQRLLGIRLAPVERGGATHLVRVVGRVVPEDTREYRINSGLDGFVRETFNDSVGTQVTKDLKLATYYAPEILAQASGFLAANARVPGSGGPDGSRTVPFPGALAKQGTGSVQGYTDRLLNLGMGLPQIKRMAESGQLPENIDVVAPADGFILARNITPGLHFMHGQEFYRIADLSKVWVAAEVYEQDARNLHPGGAATVTLRDSARKLSARITDSLPQSEAGGGTVKLRLEADNPAFLLRPDMIVDVELPVRLPPAVTVPLDALVDSGASTRVYVERGEGNFEPREVETGWRSGDLVEIRRGVRPGERVVVAATFLVDSESRLKTPASAPAHAAATPAAMPQPVAATKVVKDPNCGMPVDPAKALSSGNTIAWHGATYYFCSTQCKQAFEHDPAGAAARRQGD